MGLTSSRGKWPARLHSSMIGMRLSSMNLRAVSRTRRSSSDSNVSKSMKSTPRNLMAMKKLDSVLGCKTHVFVYPRGLVILGFVSNHEGHEGTRRSYKETFDSSRGE